MSSKPIYVTYPAVAPLPEVTQYLEQIWSRRVLTNNGPLLQQLEGEIASLHQVSQSVCVVNGTVGLEIMIELFGRGGEIITTPFSFFATSTAIRWRGCTPVFVDIDPETWNIDPDEVEKAITQQTTAILAVHVFSNPCDVVRLQEIADRHHIALLYDAAHAFGVRASGKSIVQWGDASMISYHATKSFNTVEGGGLFSTSDETLERFRQLRFLGIRPGQSLSGAGTNAKMTEFSAAVGLANLKYVDAVRQRRRHLSALYREQLAELSYLVYQKFNPEEYNYTYFPVVFRDEAQLLRVEKALNAEDIYPRRYFWPLITSVPYFEKERRIGDLAISQNISSRILCLPLFPELAEDDLARIVRIIKESC